MQGLEAGATDFVQGQCGDAVRQAGVDGSLTGGVLATASGEYLAEDNLVDRRRVNFGFVQQAADNGRAQFVGGHFGKLAPETADGGTGGGNNGEGNSASTTEGGATTAKEKEMRVLLERKKKLEGLGFDFDYGFHRKDEVADGPKNNNDRWNEKFDALKQYKERVGNADVPSTYREGEAKKDASLATWVSKQREQWRNKQRGNKGRKISDEREEKLASLGFNFEVLDAMWDARYAELKQFHEKYGTTDVTETTGSRSLWQWCKRQREAFRQFLQDQTGPMTNVRIAKMESLGFDWKYERTNEALEAKGNWKGKSRNNKISNLEGWWYDICPHL